MLNPLKIATDGYLKQQTKAVLIIAVAGYLNFTTPSGGGSEADGYGVYGNDEYAVQAQQRKLHIAKDEKEWMLLIKIYVEQCL